MKKLFLAAMLATGATAALAEEPAVTLTAPELQAIIGAEVARAQAAGAYRKVQESFAPKPAAPSAPAPKDAK